MNFCDGTEIDGYPGISIVKCLEKYKVNYTGSNSEFYRVTISKPVIKRNLQRDNVPTSKFVEIKKGFENQDIIQAEVVVGSYPMILKPAISYASISISNDSVVHSRQEALNHALKIQDANPDGIFIEQFLAGQEFTVLLTGDVKSGVKAYIPVERVFNKKLTTFERILAFDQTWAGCDDGNQGSERAVPKDGKFYWYEAAPEFMQEKLKDIAKQAYIACGGSGYGRVDIRSTSRDSLDFVVLEVNANCGLSFIPGFSSTGEIFKIGQVSPVEFIKELVSYACNRS